MQNARFRRYYLLALLGLLLASFYPLYMGVRVIVDMLAEGSVAKENYPKYIIPYTPICLALLSGMLALPACMKRFGRFALLAGSVLSVAVFFASELLFENNVVVTAFEIPTKLEDWQMYMCFVPAVTTHKTPIEILIGDYTPAFKLHFYLISVVIVLSVLNSLYGFARIAKTGEKKRLNALAVQSVLAFVFIGLCILACFTAFWRDGSIIVSPLSASLMGAFFILLGVTVGVYVGSFLLGKSKRVSVLLPALVAALFAGLMYVGEMILLNGNLYRFGTGFFFDGIPRLTLAPVDIAVIIASGALAAILSAWLKSKKHSA